ncbi:hypothetical protein TRFO_22725 [Tritrichomonas foetus]|uniref:Uncharacterized protein n=1 Tax=Tritrichomonas foetus TaxID=1144522 RepID=A0A1J4KH23_9EUKA|nr:hypothetical protein TRFO_22725 [Tritrichomonas foetus]|eukprot:OHT08645.1 hypothetical protein TRFO_22725 [Tritrichomonas foetus]
MSFFAEFFSQLRNQRIEAPRKIEFYREFSSSSGDTEEEDYEISVESATIDSLAALYVKNIKNMVDPKARVLKEGDPDYQEFGNDPKTPLLNYVDKIVKVTIMEWAALPGSIVLLNRILKKQKDAKINIINMHRLVVASLLLANKFLEDVPASNVDYSVASGFKLVLLGFLIPGKFMRY